MEEKIEFTETHTQDTQEDGEHDLAKEEKDEQSEVAEGDHTEGEIVENEHIEYNVTEGEGGNRETVREGDEILYEEHEDGEDVEGEAKKEEKASLQDEVLEEEEVYVEEPPPDPAEPYNFSDSKEALRESFELRPDQIAEVEQLWDLYQNYTPVYSDIHDYITEKELVYMLKALLLMTYTPEQLQELIEYCVKPHNLDGHITYEQFLKMVTIRQRDFPVEQELRSALQVLDPGKTGNVDREELKDLLANKGHKMAQKPLLNLIKEVDMSNDGTIGIEDVVGTMCIDLNKEDIQMLMTSINPNPPEEPIVEQM